MSQELTPIQLLRHLCGYLPDQTDYQVVSFVFQELTEARTRANIVTEQNEELKEIIKMLRTIHWVVPK